MRFFNTRKILLLFLSLEAAFQEFWSWGEMSSFKMSFFQTSHYREKNSYYGLRVDESMTLVVVVVVVVVTF